MFAVIIWKVPIRKCHTIQKVLLHIWDWKIFMKYNIKGDIAMFWYSMKYGLPPIIEETLNKTLLIMSTLSGKCSKVKRLGKRSYYQNVLWQAIWCIKLIWLKNMTVMADDGDKSYFHFSTYVDKDYRGAKIQLGEISINCKISVGCF
jgi:hypothetical protein